MIFSVLAFPMAIGAIALLLVFTITWLIQRRTNNAAIVDAVWSASFPLLAILYFSLSEDASRPKLIMLVMVFVWGMRLAIHLFVRTLGHPEDVRYTALREQWGNRQQWMMLRFFLFQGILALILSLPFVLVMVNSSAELKWMEWTGIGIWIIAVAGESVADWQLKDSNQSRQIKEKSARQDFGIIHDIRIIFSRWLVWVSFFIFALGSPWGWLSVISPAGILYFLLKVTGIPYTEIQMIKSRGQAFIDYQRSTSSIVPWFKR